MATFVAVHGAFFGGWVWKPVARLLEVQGHEFFRPTLTGCAEREHVGGPHLTLATHVQDIVSLLEIEELEDVILVGHSYAGAVIAGVAQQSAERLSGLIHLDAFLPEDGERVRDYLEPATFERASALAAESGQGWRVPFFLPLHRFCPDYHELRPWLAAQLRGVPLQPFSQPQNLERDVSGIPMLFVYCKADVLGMFETARDRAKRRPNTQVVELDTQHAVMLTQPGVVAELFHAFAERLRNAQLVN